MAEKEPENCWYHKRIDYKFPATHYARHYCPKCGRHDVIAICKWCVGEYEANIKRKGAYRWICETCGADMQRHVLGKVSNE